MRRQEQKKKRKINKYIKIKNGGKEKKIKKSMNKLKTNKIKMKIYKKNKKRRKKPRGHQ